MEIAHPSDENLTTPCPLNPPPAKKDHPVKEDPAQNIKELKHYLRAREKLISADSVEHFIHLLYKQTARRFKIKSLVFYYSCGHFGPLLAVGSAKAVYTKKAPPYPAGDKNIDPGALAEENIQIKDRADSQYLARALGRPVQNILNIAICTSQYSANSPCFLFVEFCSKNPDKLLLFYKSFLNLVTQCLDYLLLKEHLQTGIEFWTSTFNRLAEPLAVFDKQGRVSNANDMFNKVFNGRTATELNQTPVQWEGRIFEKHTYPVNIRKDKHIICHYADISESLNLRNRMIQNRKMSALGELGEAFAHQLSNPLAGVLSMAQLILRDSRLSVNTKKDMEDVVAGVLRSQEIISNLLDFSRAEGELCVCDLNSELKNTLPFVKSLMGAEGFCTEFYKEPVLIKTQAGLLKQVIFNLVKNACQAVEELDKPARKVKVCVRAKQERAFLHVEDSGQGIKPEDYKNVFKPFFTTKSKTGGTGLGLNMSKNIVESFHGTLAVSRSPLGGACFTLCLPLAKPIGVL